MLRGGGPLTNLPLGVERPFVAGTDEFFLLIHPGQAASEMWAHGGEDGDLSGGVFDHVNRLLKHSVPPAVELVDLDQFFDRRGDGLELIHTADVGPGFFGRVGEDRVQDELHDRKRKQRADSCGADGQQSGDERPSWRTGEIVVRTIGARAWRVRGIQSHSWCWYETSRL